MFYLLCRIINDAMAQGFILKLFVKRIVAILQMVLCLSNLLFTDKTPLCGTPLTLVFQRLAFLPAKIPYCLHKPNDINQK